MKEKIVDEKKKIYGYKKDFTLSLIKEMFDGGVIIPQPNTLREGMVNLDMASKNIESALMNRTIQPVYLCEEIDGTLSILDGQRRITSFVRYLNNEYSLKQLKKLRKLNGKTFTELDESMQQTLNSYILNTIIITNKS